MSTYTRFFSRLVVVLLLVGASQQSLAQSRQVPPWSSPVASPTATPEAPNQCARGTVPCDTEGSYCDNLPPPHPTSTPFASPTPMPCCEELNNIGEISIWDNSSSSCPTGDSESVAYASSGSQWCIGVHSKSSPSKDFALCPGVSERIPLYPSSLSGNQVGAIATLRLDNSHRALIHYKRTDVVFDQLIATMSRSAPLGSVEEVTPKYHTSALQSVPLGTLKDELKDMMKDLLKRCGVKSPPPKMDDVSRLISAAQKEAQKEGVQCNNLKYFGRDPNVSNNCKRNAIWYGEPNKGIAVHPPHGPGKPWHTQVHTHVQVPGCERITCYIDEKGNVICKKVGD